MQSPCATINHLATRANELGRFLADPNATQRLAEVRSPLRKKIIQVGLASTALRDQLRVYYDTYDTKPYREAGLTVIGRGFYSIATLEQSTQTVRKFHYRYTGESENVLQSIIDEYQHKQRLCQRYLGAVAVTQTYHIEPAPYDATIPMIVATQPLIRCRRFLDLVTHPPRASQVRSISSMEQFLAGNHQLITHHQAVSGLVGRHNLGITPAGELRLVDPIPLLATRPLDATPYQQSCQAIEYYAATCDV